MAIGLTGDTVRTVRFQLRNLLAGQQTRCAIVIDMQYERATLARLVALGGLAKDFVLASFARAVELSSAVVSADSL
jgi:hypothetical protein